VLYFEAYVVVDPGETDLAKGELLSEEELSQAREQYGRDAFEYGIGAEAIREMLSHLDVDEECKVLRAEMKEATSEAKRKKLAKRLKVLEAFRESGNRPEHMIMEVIPVIPPDLRPLVPLDGGRFATSDLNDLYRRVINRNNRLKRLQELNAPEVIIRNEKRMLQEAVDALFDNGRRGRVITGPSKRPLKSLSDMLKGKSGRFRQNLLGKRVDYSGRSVIVAGPELRLHQCGLPSRMALELFKPFIYSKLEQRGYVTTIKAAKKMVERERPEVWDILAEVIQEHPVILNRAPTLHRLGMQAFEPVLIDGKAIQLHPLVCKAFNADFDGDQMAVHVPLSVEAQIEARVLMMSTNNILSPATGRPIIDPSQDIVLGCYYMTRQRPGVPGEGRTFANAEEVRAAYDADELHIHAGIKVRMNGETVETTTGRTLLAEVVPPEIPFPFINQVMDKKALGELIDQAYRRLGNKATVILADRLRTLGYMHATKAGVSICLDDMAMPPDKERFIAEARGQVAEVHSQYLDGLISDGERYNKVIDIWANATERIAGQLLDNLGKDTAQDVNNPTVRMPSFNSIYMMADSGARGSAQQIRQLAGMRGLMAKPSGEIIETPITSNFREGLSVAQYFISTHGARKGLADTALKTANSGYLTRRLVDVAQDMIVREEDCGGSGRGIEMSSLVEGGEIIEGIGERILGRVALEDVRDPVNGEVLVHAGQEIDEDRVKIIENAGIEKVKIRSVLTCEVKRGVCVLCYGRDLARGEMVNLGEAVGVIAAQSIGEPGTQLTMRTFHIGGAATRRVEQSHHQTGSEGQVRYSNLRTLRDREGRLIAMNRNGEIGIFDPSGRERERYPVAYGAHIRVEDNQNVAAGAVLCEWDPFANPILTEQSGRIKFGDIVEGSTMQEQVDEFTGLSSRVIIESRDPEMRPSISVKNEADETVYQALLPVGAYLSISEGQEVAAGDVVAKIPRQMTKTKDITGGLPRVAELFEARKPKEHAIVTEIDGIVSFGPDSRGKRRVLVTPEDGEQREYLIPKGKHVSVHEGDKVRKGEPLMDGSANPHDILRIEGEQELAKWMVDEVQEVYRLQGVKINDKHIEIIIRQMLRKVRVTTVGDTDFLVGEHVDKVRFDEVNARMEAERREPAAYEPLLLGITKASLSTESFISAASFQETTKVLTEAAIWGKTDHLHGLKENVIMGRLIPAGTGLARYQNIGVQIEGLEAAAETSGGLVETSSGDAWPVPADTTAPDFGS
jgi:DNA-directed RNA polymerase subunit beta'